jgi:hypothetical protein
MRDLLIMRLENKIITSDKIKLLTSILVIKTGEYVVHADNIKSVPGKSLARLFIVNKSS